MAETEERELDNRDKEDDETQQLQVPLDWKDYVALAIAALETVLLPMVVLIVILFALVFIVR
ncbi:MAG: hypothetical protein ACLQEQ_00070 [Nitrososphaerales archaeon]